MIWNFIRQLLETRCLVTVKFNINGNWCWKFVPNLIVSFQHLTHSNYHPSLLQLPCQSFLRGWREMIKLQIITDQVTVKAVDTTSRYEFPWNLHVINVPILIFKQNVCCYNYYSQSPMYHGVIGYLSQSNRTEGGQMKWTGCTRVF